VADPLTAVSIVAELTTNHFGDLGRLDTMIRASHAAGADYVKLQKRDVDSFYSSAELDAPYESPFGSTVGDYRRRLELDVAGFEYVEKLCGSLGIGWFASVLDRPSFEFMQQFSPTIIKLPSTISGHTEFLRHVARTFAGTVVISTGMTDAAYEDFVLSTFVRAERIYLLQCTSAYPAPPEDCNVAVVRHYHEISRIDPRLFPGYSSHDDGWLGSALAIGAGARMVEKHVKVGHSPWAHFDGVAMDLSNGEFADYVAHLRGAEMLLGSPVKALVPSENHKYPYREVIAR